MATPPPRTPPRFVPTLTEVVQGPGASPIAPLPAAPVVVPPVAARPLPAATAQGPSRGAAPHTAAAAPAPQTLPATASAASPVAQAAGRALEALALRRAPSAAGASTPVAAPAVAAPAVFSPARAAVPVPPPVAAQTVAPLAPPAAVPGTVPVVPNVGQPTAARALPEGMEEYMVHRVMQRVDVALDQRLRDAIATVVQEQTRSVLPRLREEIESVVRHAVYEAVADELAGGHTAPAKG